MKGPLERAREHVGEEFGLAAYIDVRLSDGISGLPCRGEAGSGYALAAGMGGRLMVKIVEEGPREACTDALGHSPAPVGGLAGKGGFEKNGYFITEEEYDLGRGANSIPL